jgi:very-short-patch-repair endonuclease
MGSPTSDGEDLTALARELRRRQTEAERTLWSRLRNRQLEGVKFRRQQPVGPFIVDFACLERKIVVEIDDGQHADEDMLESDQARTRWLEGAGYRTLRFWNSDVLRNVEGVLLEIRDELRRGATLT